MKNKNKADKADVVPEIGIEMDVLRCHCFHENASPRTIPREKAIGMVKDEVNRLLLGMLRFPEMSFDFDEDTDMINITFDKPKII